MDIDKQFANTKKFKEKNFGKLVQLQKKMFDAWALPRFKAQGYPDMQMSYVGFLMNIDEHGIINKDLAMRFHITKQAMSKAIKEMEKLELVYTVPYENDARMSIIMLTDKGKMLVIKSVENVKEKTKEYEKLVGKERFHQALDTMYEILLYEKEKLGNTK